MSDDFGVRAGPSSPYLHDIPLHQAWSRFIQELAEAGLWKALETESVPLEHAAGRVTASPHWAIISSPHFHAAAMDGYALRSEMTEGASDKHPVTLEVGTEAIYIDTGDPMPDWADAVAPREEVELTARGAEDDPRAVSVRSPYSPWSNVRAMGEDMVATELVLPSGREVGPFELGALATAGHSTATVTARPRVAILPTGNELVPPGSRPKPGQTIESNSLVLAAQVEAWGGEARRYPILPDDYVRLREGIQRAASENHLVLVNAGSSAGSEDFTAQAIRSIGKVLVHGVAVRPGHPVILGVVGAEKKNLEAASDASPAQRMVPVIGVPGYAVSAALTGEIFVEPLISRWLGRPARQPDQITATLSRKLQSPAGDDEYLRVTLAQVGRELIAAPLGRGAGSISSLVRADGIVRIPAGVQGHQAGDRVEVRLYRTRAEIERTIMAIGSHDLVLDLLAQQLSFRGSRLTSAHVGSLAGLMALRARQAHLAGCHLLDPSTGEYNLAYVREYLPGEPVIILGFVERDQGLITAPGNPKGIENIEDLSRPDVSFVNRQRGSGTRLLLDFHRERLQVARSSIQGYNREEYTHLAVAAAVASGRADCGLGIHAASEALGLNFIPLYRERYDLIIPEEHFESALLQPLISVLEDAEFRGQVQELPGYSVEPMARQIARLE